MLKSNIVRMSKYIFDKDIERECFVNEFQNIINKIFKKGKIERNKKLLFLRWGLKDGRIKTLVELGEEFNITTERVRQIMNKYEYKLAKLVHEKYKKVS